MHILEPYYNLSGPLSHLEEKVFNPTPSRRLSVPTATNTVLCLCIHWDEYPIIIFPYPRRRSVWQNRNNELIQDDWSRLTPEFRPHHCPKNPKTRPKPHTPPGKGHTRRAILQCHQYLMHLRQAQSGTSGLYRNQRWVQISQPQHCAPYDLCTTPGRSDCTTRRPYSGQNHLSTLAAQDSDCQVDAVQDNQGLTCLKIGLHL